MSTTEYLTVIEASRMLGVTLDTLYRLIYAGRLPAQKEDRRWRLPAHAVEARRKKQEARHGTAGR